MYVAVKGGEQAIAEAHQLLAKKRRGNPETPEISVEQISGQLSLAVDRVMCEGSVYDRDMAARAIRQARGDMIEAIFLLRAYRTTLPRFGVSEPLETAAMVLERRISACFKDLPGGQLLGPTFDYTHRLIGDDAVTLDEALESHQQEDAVAVVAPHVTSLLGSQGLIEPSSAVETEPPGDLTRTPLSFPAERDLRLQNLARGDEGFLLALGYSTQRGYGRNHPFAGEIRMGQVEVSCHVPELGFAICLGTVQLTECEMVTQFRGGAEHPPQFTRGYGLVFGQSERKAMSMALVDRALRAREFGEDLVAPAQDEEFVLSHSDVVQATGFVEHLKLPHYVDFQAELLQLRALRAEWDAKRAQSRTHQEAAE